MDIYEFALEKENLARDYYKQLAAKTSNSGLQTIFNMLAEEEQKHVQTITQMKQNDEHEVADSPVLNNAKEVFNKMRQAADNFKFDISEQQLYEKARDIEKKAMDYYVQKANEVDIDWQQQVFKKLAAEEKKHYVLMDNICEMLMKPKLWLENAEFFHIDDY